MNDTPRFAVTYGNLNDGSLNMVFVASASTVRSLAFKFITVIPDDLKSYARKVKAWDGVRQLRLEHQDDDYFVFIARPCQTSDKDERTFNTFVKKFKFEDCDSEG